MKNKKGSMIGVSLIFVVFVLLCLVTFGTLSLMLSEQDNAFSLSVAENVEEFYQGDIVAQEKLKTIDDSLALLYDEASDLDSYQQLLSEVSQELDVTVIYENEEIFIEFITPISENEELYSKISICYPLYSGGVYYYIDAWNLQSIN